MQKHISILLFVKNTGFKNSLYLSYSFFILTLIGIGYSISTLNLLPFDPEDLDFDAILSPPLSNGHLLGTDDLGRDILSRLIVGIDAYLLPALLALSIALVFGIFIAIATLFWRRKISHALSVINDALLVMPRLVLLLLIIAIFEPDIIYIMIIIGISNIPTLTQLLSGKIDLLKERSFIDSSIAAGLSYPTIIFKHVLWCNCRVILFSQSAFIMGEAILMEASLSYLGFGVQEPTPSWGNMVQSGSNYLLQGELWPSTIPAIAIMLVISAFYLLSYTINHIMEPSAK